MEKKNIFLAVNAFIFPIGFLKGLVVLPAVLIMKSASPWQVDNNKCQRQCLAETRFNYSATTANENSIVCEQPTVLSCENDG